MRDPGVQDVGVRKELGMGVLGSIGEEESGAPGMGVRECWDMRPGAHHGRGGNGNGGAGSTPSYKDTRRIRTWDIQENRAWGRPEQRTQRELSIPSSVAGHTSGEPA